MKSLFAVILLSLIINGLAENKICVDYEIKPLINKNSFRWYFIPLAQNICDSINQYEDIYDINCKVLIRIIKNGDILEPILLLNNSDQNKDNLIKTVINKCNPYFKVPPTCKNDTMKMEMIIKTVNCETIKLKLIKKQQIQKDY